MNLEEYYTHKLELITTRLHKSSLSVQAPRVYVGQSHVLQVSLSVLVRDTEIRKFTFVLCYFMYGLYHCICMCI